jgi:hypothetical protein
MRKECRGRRRRRNLSKLALLLSAGLAGCSSGGSGPAPSPVVATNPSPPSPPSASVPAFQPSSLSGNSLPLATASTPNFTTNLPANGAAFPLDETAIKFAANPFGVDVVTDAGGSLSGGVTLTFQGVQVADGVTRLVVGLKAPGLSIDVPILPGNHMTFPDGSQVQANATALNYTVLASWSVYPVPPTTTQVTYRGWGVTGYQTPPSAVPTSGTATYTSGISGAIYMASDSRITSFGVGGQASIGVNFSSGAVTGSLTSMTACCSGPGEEPSPTPWNDVVLTGSLSGATVRGTTSVTTSPSNPLALPATAKGAFSGALFGPNGQEIGINWNLYDPAGGGKAAFGALVGTRQ